MRMKKMGLAWVAFLTLGAIAGCSGVDDQASAPDGKESNVEVAGTSCALTGKSKMTDTQVTRDSLNPNAFTIVANACKCCIDHYKQATAYCENQGYTLGKFHCQEECGLCGRDDAYKSAYFICDTPCPEC